MIKQQPPSADKRSTHYRKRSGDLDLTAKTRKRKDIDLKSAKQQKQAATNKQLNRTKDKPKTYYNKSAQHLQDKEPSVIQSKGRTYRVRDQYNSRSQPTFKQHKKRFLDDSDSKKFKQKNRTIQTAKRMAYLKAHQKAEDAGEDNIGINTVHRTEQTAEAAVKVTRKAYRTNRTVQNQVAQTKLYHKTYKEAKSKLYDKQRLQAKPSDTHQQAQKRQPAKLDIQKRINQKKMHYRVRLQHTMEQAQQFVEKRKFRLILDAAKQIIVRNRVLLVGLILVILFTLISCGVVVVLSGAMTLLETTTYNADRAELDKIVEYITQKDEDTIDMFDHMGDSYDRYTLKYIGTGQIATSPMQMLSYVNVLLKDQFDLPAAIPPIDNMYTLMYSYTSHVTNDGTAEAPIWHLWVTVDCKTVTQVIDEQSLFSDFDRQWYDVLNQTGGNYLVGNLGNPFPGIDWTGSITDPYGFRVHPITGKHSFHTGLDIAMGEGSAISSVQSGTVITATYGDNIWGNYVEIDDGNTRTKYAHCSSLNVSVGDIVKTGDVIGFVGSTGQSTGPHLHIEVIIGGQRYDPAMQLSRN